MMTGMRWYAGSAAIARSMSPPPSIGIMKSSRITSGFSSDNLDEALLAVARGQNPIALV